MNPLDNPSNVKNYYDTSAMWYRWFYYDGDSLALHYGFWDTPNTSRKEALINQYRVILGLLNQKPGELILDAGCGVGGACFWLAERTQANYIGITISEVQLKLAEKYGRKRNIENSVTFYLKNYFDTKFNNETFDKIFAIESFCYAYPNPRALYAEMFRVLKPGGAIVISDGVLLRHPENQDEKMLAEKFCRGFKMAGWNTPEEIIAYLEDVGFSEVRYFDKTKEIKKSVIDIRRRSRMLSPFRLLRYLGLVTKIEEEILLATKAQMKMYEKGLFGYGIFTAEKSLKTKL